jgi:oxygen-independent coproporphyrinogen-3 oxidase
MSFGIYVHWPFCATRCPYCDFNAHVRVDVDEDAWVEALEAELAFVRGRQEPAPIVSTVFFGGGTPSLMDGRTVGRVLERIAALWPMANDVEVTLEANPASTEAARFADYRAAGVNRLSLGMQALNDADLKTLGRLHDVAEARGALKLAQRHFVRVSLDLIYARPAQSVAAWRAELKQALTFGTSHMSLYQLTIEPDTPYALLTRTGKLHIPADDLAADLYEATQEVMEAAGLPAYEISNHARPGEECRHNLIYWRYGDYAGVGPGAHGRVTWDGARIATAAIRLPERWVDSVARLGHGFADMTPIRDADGLREHLLMNLRLREGIDLAAYERRWGTRPAAAVIADLSAQGLVTLKDDVLAATPAGRLLLNRVITALLD